MVTHSSWFVFCKDLRVKQTLYSCHLGHDYICNHAQQRSPQGLANIVLDPLGSCQRGGILL